MSLERQIAQLEAGLVDGVQLLTLQHLGRDVANADHEQIGAVVFVGRDRPGLHFVIRFLADAEAALGELAGTERRVQRAEIGPDDLGRAERFVKTLAEERIFRARLRSGGRIAYGFALRGEFAKLAIAPEDAKFVIEQRGSVGQLVEQHAGRQHRRNRAVDLRDAFGVCRSRGLAFGPGEAERVGTVVAGNRGTLEARVGDFWSRRHRLRTHRLRIRRLKLVTQQRRANSTRSRSPTGP